MLSGWKCQLMSNVFNIQLVYGVSLELLLSSGRSARSSSRHIWYPVTCFETSLPQDLSDFVSDFRDLF